MDLQIGRSLAACALDVRARDALTVDRNLAGNVQERAKLRIDRRSVRIVLDVFDEVDSAVELDSPCTVVSCSRAVAAISDAVDSSWMLDCRTFATTAWILAMTALIPSARWPSSSRVVTGMVAVRSHSPLAISCTRALRAWVA